MENLDRKFRIFRKRVRLADSGISGISSFSASLDEMSVPGRKNGEEYARHALRRAFPPELTYDCEGKNTSASMQRTLPPAQSSIVSIGAATIRACRANTARCAASRLRSARADIASTC